MIFTCRRLLSSLLRQLIAISALNDLVNIQEITKVTATVEFNHLSCVWMHTETIDIDLEHGRERLDSHELLRILLAMLLM